MSKINWWVWVFFLVALSLGLPALHADDSSQNAAFSQNVVSTESQASSAPVEATPGVDSAVEVAQREVRDPFAAVPTEAAAPVSGAAPAGPEVPVQLQGIGFGSKDAYAVIGGEIFYKGDEKMGIKLLEVRRREVDILANGGKVTIPLFPGEDLKKAKDRAKTKGGMINASEDQSSEGPSSLSKGEQPPL